jgi:DNA-binding CsgD family transcriptional regulator/tetratricopeptide (TPR) repeat protein
VGNHTGGTTIDDDRADRLLERDAELDTLSLLWRGALSGRGRLVFLGGEAGAGKTSVAFEFAHRYAARARFLVGVCDGGATPRALGPLVDVADQLGLAAELDAVEVRHVSLFARVRTALGRVPTILLLEDVHWADQGTLDLIRHLGRRVGDVPLLTLVTFRDDEVTAAHPLAGVMGDLATAAGVLRMQLPLLTEAAVAELARGAGREIDVAALHRRTDGNPFFVTEVLAAGTETVPTTVRDAVVARATRLSPAAHRVLDAAAVVGASAEIGLLLASADEDPVALDECVAGGVLLDRGDSVAFRHDLARQAIVDGLPPAARAAMHRRVLASLIASGSRDHRRLAHHALACGDAAAVVVHAPRAAAVAARLGAHREAAQHLRTALQYGDALAAPERAKILDSYSYECYLISDLAEAVEARQLAVALHEAAGNRRGVGVDERWLSRFFWYLGRHDEAHRFAAAAVDALEPLGPGGDLAMAYSNLSQLQMLGGDTEDALVWGRLALDDALAFGDREVEAHALNNVGTALLLRGDLVEGRASLARSLDISVAEGLEEHAVRVWINLGTVQLSKRNLLDAEQTLRTGIAYCNERDLLSGSLYLQARLSQALLERGRVDEAARLAADTLRHPHSSAVSRVSALLTTATLSVRTGDPAAATQLAELGSLAEATAEPQRLLPVALLLAEAAWTAGRTGEIGGLTDDVWTAYRSWEPWILAELAWWRRLGGAAEEPGHEGAALRFAQAAGEPAPFALMRLGRAREAAAAWTAIGRPHWAALALAGGEPADASEAVAGLLRLGAPATAQAVRRELAARGLPVPRGPRRTSRDNPAGLTGREVDVLRLIVEGLSDAEIASRLTLSERTVGHHVSAVLRKFGVPSRSKAAAVAGPILESTSQPG